MISVRCHAQWNWRSIVIGLAFLAFLLGTKYLVRPFRILFLFKFINPKPYTLVFMFFWRVFWFFPLLGICLLLFPEFACLGNDTGQKEEEALLDSCNCTPRLCYPCNFVRLPHTS